MKALENKDFGELPDPRLENKFDEAQMYHMIEAAAACVRHSDSMRPRMGQVILLHCLCLSYYLFEGGLRGTVCIIHLMTATTKAFSPKKLG
jgi:hypothetical protein